MNKTEDIGGLKWKTVAAVKLEGKQELALDILRHILNNPAIDNYTKLQMALRDKIAPLLLDD